MSEREINVCQQTWALLHKNLLKKWRMKRESLTEWMSSLLLLFPLYLLVNFDGYQVNDFSSLSTMNLGRVDSFNYSTFSIVYTPITRETQQIMAKVATTSFMTDQEVVGLSEEKHIEELGEEYSGDIASVTFTDTYSYHLKFLSRGRIPEMKENSNHEGHCHEIYENVYCHASIFWKGGFVALQAAINAAIIETTTNHSVMEELMSLTGKYMKIYPFVSRGEIETDFFIFFCIISFSPFTYYASTNVTRERKRMKSLMTMMGLRDSAFWLSWGLLYAGFVFILALILAFVIKFIQFFFLANFMEVFTLFFLYGLSMIALTFLMSVLVKKPFLTGFVVFFLTIFCGSLGFIALYRHLPMSLEWILSVLSPFAFTLGMVQVRSHLILSAAHFLLWNSVVCIHFYVPHAKI